MKNIQKTFDKKLYTTAFSALLFLSSCTGDYMEINTNPSQISSLSTIQTGYLFSKAQSEGSYKSYDYQVAQNLFADLYSQYFATSAIYFSTDRYNWRSDWATSAWNSVYVGVAPQLKEIMKICPANSAEVALAKIWWVYVFHRLTDYFGPIPYSQVGNGQTVVKYDKQDTIYLDFFAKLTEAVNTLKLSSSDAFGSYDLIYRGSRTQWIKFANSLKLRLALRISDVNPSFAKTMAEEAVVSGVMADNTDNAFMRKSGVGDDTNGLALICNWGEFRMSATMESVLKGYNDPRLKKYFSPNESSSSVSEYTGIRNGLSPVQLSGVNTNTSNVGQKWLNNNVNQITASQEIMVSAETYLNRAEGALKGWNMGDTAKNLYNKGIEMSMLQWGIPTSEIMAYMLSASVPVNVNYIINSPAVSSVPILWSSNSSMQLEQIATQKWLALYPDGIEAWADARRSDRTPKYTIINNENPDIPTGEFIKRLPFLTSEISMNGTAVTEAVTLLGGPDKASTRLWWDVH